MKFVPRHNEIMGRYVTPKSRTVIVRPDETKDTTVFVLVDAVGPGALAAGIKVGDVVVPAGIRNVKLDGGASLRPSVDEKNVLYWVEEYDLAEFNVQTDNGKQFVPFEDEHAAKSLGGARRQSNGRSEENVVGAPA